MLFLFSFFKRIEIPSTFLILLDIQYQTSSTLSENIHIFDKL